MQPGGRIWSEGVLDSGTPERARREERALGSVLGMEAVVTRVRVKALMVRGNLLFLYSWGMVFHCRTPGTEAIYLPCNPRRKVDIAYL
jgi:hypothetical protein